jgi:hypothetical protein
MIAEPATPIEIPARPLVSALPLRVTGSPMYKSALLTGTEYKRAWPVYGAPLR